jgi:hypothetical protein
MGRPTSRACPTDGSLDFSTRGKLLAPLRRLYHRAGAQTPRADAQIADGALLHRLDPAQIRFPAALGVIIGVADVIPHLGMFAAQVAGVGHDGFLLKSLYSNLKYWQKQGEKA